MNEQKIDGEQERPKAPAPRDRVRRFLLHHLPLTVAGSVFLLALATAGLYFIASSAAFENLARKRLIASIEEMTGGHVEVVSFHWRLLHLEAEADGVTIHGLEDPGDAPLARIERLRVVLSLRNLFSPTIRLRSLEIDRPSLHFIVYPDGSTNQPHPSRRQSSSKSGIETLFNLHAGRIAVERGKLDYDCRAASFDYQDRYMPLDFTADDTSLAMRYVSQPWTKPAFYRIEVGIADFDLSRAIPHKSLAVHGQVQATLDLERTQLHLRSLRVTAERRGGKRHALDISGDLSDFTHPKWHARLLGELDLGLIEPMTGYADAPQGIARVDLTAAGGGHAFQIDGGIFLQGATYNGVGIDARNIDGQVRVHADERQLLISEIEIQTHDGGRIQGMVSLSPWLPTDPSAHRLASIRAAPSAGQRNILVRAPDWIIPVNGKVQADFENVALDTALDIVAPPAFRRLGLDARLNGSASAAWSHGDSRTVLVSAQLGLSPSRQSPSGEAPATGTIDATYTHQSGAVEVRKLELHLPASELEAHGKLGAYPVVSPSEMAIDFHSHNLAEFDTALRGLGVKRHGRTGVAALPVTLEGQGDFHGMWTGSLVRPHIAGDLQAKQLAVELPDSAGSTSQQTLYFDTVSAEGNYAPAQISIKHAELVHGGARFALGGTLDAAPGRDPRFDTTAVLHAHVDASEVDLAEVQPFLASAGFSRLPAAGALSARFELDGPLSGPAISGSLAMARGTIYNEPVTNLHAEGSFSDSVLKLGSATASEAGGSLSTSGNLNFKTKSFVIDARARNIDVSQLGVVRRGGLDATGKLTFALTGSGTLSKPQLEGLATVTDPALNGQRFGVLQIAAHSAGPLLNYTASTTMDQASLRLHGQTALQGDYFTRAQLAFSRFNLGTALRMARVGAFDGASALEGTVSVSGPLARPDALAGEAQLRQLAFTISGVQFRSDGGLHATFASGRIHLDPVHVTGEDSDLRAYGDLSLNGSRQLDLAAAGAINLKIAETIDPDLTASGSTTFQVQAHGPLNAPNLQGQIDFENGALSFGDLPNGLSQLHGTLVFNQNRLEVKSLTAMSGGGLLNLGGYLAYQHGLFADLSVTGNEVHIRYPDGVSSLADATLHLRGPQNNLLLSGDVLITRFSVSPDLDLASLAGQAGSAVQTMAPPDAPSNHLRLDVHIVSSPQLSFQNAFAKLAGNVDLRLRGTLASPSLLGRVAITEGSALIAGTRYDLERGDVTFTNPVRIEPNINLSATAHVEDYDISLGLHGTLQKLAVNYRSDPPLPEADVVSLLALGHAASQQRLYTQQQQEQTITNPTDAILGGALNATVSSRIQKLFGAGSVKVDPNYLGAFGNSTSRITVQEQFGRIVTLTYATDVDTASEQLLQAEVAINRHVSLVVARDESGVFSIVVKATRRYR